MSSFISEVVAIFVILCPSMFLDESFSPVRPPRRRSGSVPCSARFDKKRWSCETRTIAALWLGRGSYDRKTEHLFSTKSLNQPYGRVKFRTTQNSSTTKRKNKTRQWQGRHDYHKHDNDGVCASDGRGSGMGAASKHAEPSPGVAATAPDLRPRRFPSYPCGPLSTRRPGCAGRSFGWCRSEAEARRT